MSKAEWKAISEIKKIICNPDIPFLNLLNCLQQNLLLISFENVCSQKLMIKTYKAEHYTEQEKETVFELFKNTFPDKLVNNYIIFFKQVITIEEKYYGLIKNDIKMLFASLDEFVMFLGKYVCENPEMISFAKELLMQAAEDVLPRKNFYNAVKLFSYEGISWKKRKVFIHDYEMAIWYGVLAEKLDDVSFGKEMVVDYHFDIKPCFTLEVTDWSWKRRLMYASSYYVSVANSKYERLMNTQDPMYHHYKCYICKRASLLNTPYDIYDLIMNLVNRQFAAETTMDYLTRINDKVGTTLTYVLSMYFVVYIELLFLMFNKDNYLIISINELKERMFGSNYIDDDECYRIYRLAFRNYDKIGNFMVVEEGVLVGKWMFNSDYLVFEQGRERIFNSQNDHRLGKELNEFGKEVVERFVRDIADSCGWKTIKSNFKIKKTDIDLVAYKSGTVILGQIKSNHCVRTPYSLWKASRIIEEANEQIDKCKEAIEKDENLLYSSLKRENIVNKRTDIKEIKYIIISGNGYLETNKKNIPVISIEDLHNLLTLEKENLLFDEFLNCPPIHYELIEYPEYRESVVETEEYKIVYNELE